MVSCLTDLNKVSETCSENNATGELETIEESKNLLATHIFTTLNRNNPQSLKTVFYDLSITTFTGTKCPLSKCGRANVNAGANALLFAGVKIDDAAMGFIARLDGFWALVTNHCEVRLNDYVKPAEEIASAYSQNIRSKNRLEILNHSLKLRLSMFGQKTT